MSGTTGNRGYVYPTLADANDVPYYMQTLAEALDLDIAALNNPAPVTPTYAAGWGDYNPDNPVFLGVQATRSSGGLVGLSGMFARLGSTLNTNSTQVIGTLPVGYRPARRILIILTGYTGSSAAGGTGLYANVRVDITTDGQILAQWLQQNTWAGSTGGSASYVSLAGLSYVAGA